MPEFVVRHRRLLFAVLLLAAPLLLRWPSLHRQIWNLDEGSTITMAQMILAGQVPYLEAADNRTPLVPYAKALVLAVAGDWNTRAIHAAVALMLGLAAILLWQAARRLGREAVGVLAAILFTGLSVGLIPAIDSLTAHTGWFLVFFSSLGFWLFSVALTRSSFWIALAAGAAFGLSALAKQPGVLDFGVCLVILLLAVIDPGPRIRLARLALGLGLGLVLPLAATAAYFHHRGALADLEFYAWTYNTRYYVPEVPQLDRLLAVRVPFELLLTRLPVVLLVGGVAAAGLLREALASLRRRAIEGHALEWLILGWSAAGLLSTMLSGRDFDHYSIQFIPGLSLACGWILARARTKSAEWRAAGRTGHWRLVQAATILAIASVAIPTLVGLRQLNTSDGYSAEIGRLVAARSRPQDRIFVWGYLPEMHVYARRLPSTRFFYTNWVTGLVPWTNLDWLKDTSYAVIPGTPAQLRQDFERRPPTVIVDTGTTRGYAKYPLQAQGWLWTTIEREFAEVEPDFAHPRGFRVFQRIADAPYGRRFPATVPLDPAVRLGTPAPTRPATIPIRVDYPAGTHAVELYKDDELYRRLECPADKAGAVVFNVLGSDLPEGERRFQALVRGGSERGSAVRTVVIDPALPLPPPGGPPLVFNGQEIPALEATNLHGAMGHVMDSRLWDAHAPSNLVYRRPPGLYLLEFEFGMNDIVYERPELMPTDGVEFLVQFITDAGEVRTLFRQPLNPQAPGHGADRGLHREKLLLSFNDPGRIAFRVSPGAASDVTSDLAYWRTIRGSGAPGPIFFRDQRIHATHVETTYAMQPLILDGNNVVLVHAPSRLDFPLQPGMHRLTGTLGLHPNAWSGPKKSAGAVFEFWHIPADGQPRLLSQFPADPANNPAHRGPQPFVVNLPYPTEGTLRLVTRPAHPEDNAFNYTYWGPLTAEEFTATIATADQPVRSNQAESTFGFADMDEAGRTVTFAHAPSLLAFPLRGDARRLTGEIGLLASAYAGADATEGGRFVIEAEDATGRRTTLWHHDLNPRDVPADRGFIPFALDLPERFSGRLILRTQARPGHSPGRTWTYWHNLRLDP